MVISRSNLTDGRKNPILAAALKLAELGFYIYPSPKKNGAARVKWRLNSTRYSPTITRWWTQWPRDLICLDCGKSKIAVIDADSIEGHGIDGLTNLLDPLSQPLRSGRGQADPVPESVAAAASNRKSINLNRRRRRRSHTCIIRRARFFGTHAPRG
jgi:hypothetical protein